MTSASAHASGLGLGKARMVGVVCALGLAAIHLIEMPEDFEEMPYLGVLFGVGGVLLVVVAVGLVRRSATRLAWLTGALAAAGMFVGYCISRTVGLPGMETEAWGEPLGILSLVLEVVFLASAVVAAVAFTANSRSRESTRTASTIQR